MPEEAKARVRLRRGSEKTEGLSRPGDERGCLRRKVSNASNDTPDMKHFEIVELADARRKAEWQAYVARAPNASLYHALEWRDFLLCAFGHRSWYLMALDDGKTCGVLPLIEMKSSLFGHFFVSLPFLDYGGILADTPECETALAIAAADLAAKRGARHVELRQSFAAAGCAKAGWQLRQHKS